MIFLSRFLLMGIIMCFLFTPHYTLGYISSKPSRSRRSSSLFGEKISNQVGTKTSTISSPLYSFQHPNTLAAVWSASKLPLSESLRVPGDVVGLYDTAEFTYPLLQAAYVVWRSNSNKTNISSSHTLNSLLHSSQESSSSSSSSFSTREGANGNNEQEKEQAQLYLSELANLYTQAKYSLVNRSKYHALMGGSMVNYTFPKPVPMWVEYDPGLGIHLEVVLDSSQFVYVVCRLLRIISEMGGEEFLPSQQRRTYTSSSRKEKAKSNNDNFSNFVSTFSTLIVEDFLWRWIFSEYGGFQTHGWGCSGSPTPMNHSVLLYKKYHWLFGKTRGPKYCNAVQDVDMWIVTSVMEILAAHAANPNVVPLSSKQRTMMMNYGALGVKLIQSRIEVVPTSSRRGGHKKEAEVGGAKEQPEANKEIPSSSSSNFGFIFDKGLWEHHPDYAYAGYQGTTYPKQGTGPYLVKNLTWDVSHGRRFVPVFNTLDHFPTHLYQEMNIPAATASSFSATENHIVKKTTSLSSEKAQVGHLSLLLSNQWFHEVYNGNCSFPLFQNYFNREGWYRVGYHGNGFGYGLGDDGCQTGMTGGFGLLLTVNQDISELNSCLWNFFQNASSVDPIKEFRDDHYFSYWDNFKHGNSSGQWIGAEYFVRLLSFVPTLLRKG